MEGLISEGVYKWRDLYLQGPTTGIEKNISKHAIALLIKIQFALTWFLTSCKISFQYIWNRS